MVTGFDVFSEVKQSSQEDSSGPHHFANVREFAGKAQKFCFVHFLRDFQDCSSCRVSAFLVSGTLMDMSLESMRIPRKGREVVGGTVFSIATGKPRSLKA